MKKNFIAFGLAVVFMASAPTASALSCLPTDMYLDTIVGDGTTQVFVGTATEVKNHTQVVTVTKAHQGWVAPQVWVTHPWSSDWQYFCSNGPAKAGVPTVFIVSIDQYGSFSVNQTLPLDSDLAKNLIQDLNAREDVDAGITEVKPADRAGEMRQSIIDLMKALVNMLTELRYWESAAQ
jgi:hypothetical protein